MTAEETVVASYVEVNHIWLLIENMYIAGESYHDDVVYEDAERTIAPNRLSSRQR